MMGFVPFRIMPLSFGTRGEPSVPESLTAGIFMFRSVKLSNDFNPFDYSAGVVC